MISFRQLRTGRLFVSTFLQNGVDLMHDFLAISSTGFSFRGTERTIVDILLRSPGRGAQGDSVRHRRLGRQRLLRCRGEVTGLIASQPLPASRIALVTLGLQVVTSTVLLPLRVGLSSTGCSLTSFQGGESPLGGAAVVISFNISSSSRWTA